MPQEVLSKLGSDEDCDDGSTVRINQHHIQRPPFLVFRRHGFPVYQPCSVSSVPPPSLSSLPAVQCSGAIAFQFTSRPVFRRHRFPVYQPCSVSSVPAPSVSMGVYSVNLVILEGPDTETVTDISVTVTTEEMFDVRSAQSKRR